MKTRVGLLQVASDFDVANHFICEIASALEELGHVTCVVESADDLIKLAHFAPEWVLSINGVALDVEIGGQPLPQAFGARSLSITVDNPMQFAQRWEKAGTGVVTVVDRTIASTVQGAWPHLDVSYLPHGACGSKGPDPTSDRPIDVLVTGIYQQPCFAGIESDRYKWLVQHLSCADTDSPWRVRARTFHDLVSQSVAQEVLEHGVRYQRRTRLLSALTQAGIFATVVGPGWETHPDASEHNLLGSKPFSQVMELFAQSKVVMHVAASIDAHERPLTAMLQGAAVVVPATGFWTTHFPEAHLDARELLDHPDQRYVVASACQQRVTASHTWKERFRNFQW